MALRVNTSAMRLFFALCLFASLGSCGGGGGSGGGVSSTPTPPSGGSPAPPLDYDTAEYQRTTGSVAMDAIAAYDAGETGTGRTEGGSVGKESVGTWNARWSPEH